ncbi:MAG: phage major capsid protein [Janthinobacterium lividum]
MSIQALREQKATFAATISALMASTSDKVWTPENQTAYDSGMASIDAIDASIKRTNDFNARMVADQREEIVVEGEKHAKDKKSPQAAAFAKWLRGGDKALSAADVEVIRNTMSVGGAGSEGGYTVPTETATSLIEKLKAFGGMRAVATPLNTTSGNPMSFPTADATSEIGEIVAENASTTALDTAFGTIGLPVYKYSSKSVAVPIELLQDSNIDIEGYLNRLLATRLGRITNRHFTYGTGSSQPRGIVTAAPVGYTAANGGSEVLAVKYDSLVELQHSIDPAYRQAGNSKFMMADSSVKVVRKIKDSNGRPIFVPGYETGNPGGAPDSILGAPIEINQDVAAMAAGAASILFGDFSYYTIRDALGLILRRFDDSAFALKGQVGFCAWLRSGGNLLDNGGAVASFVNAAT